MNNDIHLLGEEFEKEVLSCKKEEDALKDAKRKLEEALSILNRNNESRIAR